MPDLPHLSGKEIIRALERLGFVQARQNRATCGDVGDGQADFRGDMSGFCEEGEPVRAWGGEYCFSEKSEYNRVVHMYILRSA